jgi:hypothetical protein
LIQVLKSEKVSVQVKFTPIRTLIILSFRLVYVIRKFDFHSQHFAVRTTDPQPPKYIKHPKSIYRESNLLAAENSPIMLPHILKLKGSNATVRNTTYRTTPTHPFPHLSVTSSLNEQHSPFCCPLLNPSMYRHIPKCSTKLFPKCFPSQFSTFLYEVALATYIPVSQRLIQDISFRKCFPLHFLYN